MRDYFLQEKEMEAYLDVDGITFNFPFYFGPDDDEFEVEVHVLENPIKCELYVANLFEIGKAVQGNVVTADHLKSALECAESLIEKAEREC